MIPNNQIWFNNGGISFKPSDITGLLLEAYSENSLVSGNDITQITDISGNSNHLTQSTPGLQPQLVANQYNGYPTSRNDGIDDYMTFPTLTNIRTVFWVIMETPGATNDARTLLGHNALFPFHRGANKNYFEIGVSSANVTSGVLKLDGAVIPISNPVPTKLSVTSVVTTGNVTANNFANDRISFGRVWDGDFCALLIYDNPLTSAQVIQVENYLKKKYAIVPYNMIYDGDSFFATYSTVTEIVAGLVALNKGPSTQNVSVGGSGIGVTTSSGGNYMLQPTRYNIVKNKYLSGGKNIISVYEGINDLYYNLQDGNSVSTSVNNVYNNFLTYVTGLTALGFKVIINTLTPRNNVGTPVNYETARQNNSNKLDNTTINGKLRNDFTVVEGTRIFSSNLSQWNNCILVDVGNDPNFGQIGQETNPIYYDPDLVHPTVLMQTQLANNYYVPAIQIAETF